MASVQAIRRVAVCLVDRANYGRLKPVMQAIQQHGIELDMRVLCAGSMVLRRFGRTVDLVRSDGFLVHEELPCSVEGSTPETMAHSVAMATQAFAGAFARQQPDIVLLIGDRLEALGAATAAAYSNRCIVHLQGGEQSGSIDESARHAITMLSHYHVPATKRAKRVLLQLGQDPATIIGIGCPVADIAAKYLRRTDGPVLVAYHPNTTHWQTSADEIRDLALRVARLKGQHDVIWLWPNIDAGSYDADKAIRRARESLDLSHVQFVTNMPPEAFYEAMSRAPLCIGNSSSFVRDAGFWGVPVELIGDRQQDRERDVSYGEPGISAHIARMLTKIPTYTQKRLVVHERARDHTSEGRQQGNLPKEPCQALWSSTVVVDSPVSSRVESLPAHLLD